MKLGEIKIEALYLCFATPELCIDTDDDTMLTETLHNLKNDPNYTDYLNAMVGAVNRCFSVFEARGLTPRKKAVIPFDEAKVENGRFTMELKTLLPDFVSLDGAYISENGELPAYIDHAVTGGEISLPVISKGESYIVSYIPEMKRISHKTPESYEIELPRRLCDMMPYFIKGDIMRVDDAHEAQNAKDTFDAMCAEVRDDTLLYTSIVRNVYGMG